MATKLEKEYTELATRTSIALEGLQKAIADINDTNILHVKALESNTKTVENNTKVVQNIKDFWGKILFILVIAVVILAGVEKFSNLLGT